MAIDRIIMKVVADNNELMDDPRSNLEDGRDPETVDCASMALYDLE